MWYPRLLSLGEQLLGVPWFLELNEIKTIVPKIGMPALVARSRLRLVPSHERF